MRELLIYGVKVGRLGGVPVHVHLTFAFVVLYLLLTTQSLAFDAALVAVWLVSTLLHELGHTSAARKIGGSAERIVLWPLGGLALTRHADTARAEAIVSAAGPAVNLALGLIALGLLLLRPDAPPLGEIRLANATLLTNALVLVAVLNLALFAFNVLPAFPLDGGGIARSLLRALLDWKRGTLITGALGVLTGGAVIAAAVTWRAPGGFALGLVFVFSSGLAFVRAYRFTPLPELDDLMPFERGGR